MIILTAAQASQVRGQSSTAGWAALAPVLLYDGTFMLSENVLTDPAHADAKAFLSTLPKQTVPVSNIYKYIGATAIQNQTYLTALASVPTWQSVGVVAV